MFHGGREILVWGTKAKADPLFSCMAASHWNSEWESDAYMWPIRQASQPTSQVCALYKTSCVSAVKTLRGVGNWEEWSAANAAV